MNQTTELSPITDDPKEWRFINREAWGDPVGVWQNQKNGDAFSSDEGKTYFLLSEGACSANPNPLHTSITKD